MHTRNPGKLRKAALLGSACLLALTAAGYANGAGPAPDPAPDDAAAAQVWITTADGEQRLARGADAAFDGAAQPVDIRVDTGEKAQEFTGAGASVTEASARLVGGLPKGERDALLAELFGTGGDDGGDGGTGGDGRDGIGLDYLRQPLSGSDFVAELPYFTYEDEPGSFSLARHEKEVLPLVREAKGINPDIRVMGTPWSPPAWMKDGGKLEGGTLEREHYEDYADHLVRTAKAYAEAGVPLDDLTVQNEPLFETTYPSAHLTAAEQADFFRVLDDKLTAAGLDTALFAYDHNWDKPEYPLEVLEKTKDIERVQGAAFHCYGGQPEAQQQVRDAGERVFFTECSGTDSEDPAKTFPDTLKWQTENLVIRSLRSGAETVVLWNLALDAKGGPHFGNCGTRCNGVVEIEGGKAAKNAEFYSLGHVSRFVDRGARRVGSTSEGPGRVQNVAFENPDGSRAAVVLNSTDGTRRFSVTENGKSLEYELPAGAVATFNWSGPPGN